LLLVFIEYAQEVPLKSVLVTVRSQKFKAYIFKLPAAVGVSFCTLDKVAIIEKLIGVDALEIFLLFPIAAHCESFLYQAAI
jgi:hypothetical protein